jgi:hypothetical protein
MKIHFLLDQRVQPEPNATFVAAMALLADQGFTVSRGIRRRRCCARTASARGTTCTC